ncbi:MAG: RpiB/LacA/LacB family sugar-phosphate isomerase [Holosporales bacterium]|jgi:ribose 5-phosphate isomerase B|nr:RpiB/LacA/LacB family sugar-phosphate isomerase [Holosporales bacterium]
MSSFRSIVIASDHRGYWLKKDIIERLKERGFYIVDFGAENDCIPVDYVGYAKRISEYVLSNDETFGVLIGYFGLGMTIAANRFKGIRAVFCNRIDIPQMARETFNANIICLGSNFISVEHAVRCLEIFATTTFDERHSFMINKIDEDEP